MTNITKEHRELWEALRNPEYTNFGLFSCFVDDEPAVAIVAVNESDEEYNITPLFVSVTPKMSIRNHDGEEAA